MKRLYQYQYIDGDGNRHTAKISAKTKKEAVKLAPRFHPDNVKILTSSFVWIE